MSTEKHQGSTSRDKTNCKDATGGNYTRVKRIELISQNATNCDYSATSVRIATKGAEKAKKGEGAMKNREIGRTTMAFLKHKEIKLVQ